MARNKPFSVLAPLHQNNNVNRAVEARYPQPMMLGMGYYIMKLSGATHESRPLEP
jgi:hypothetical protein